MRTVLINPETLIPSKSKADTVAPRYKVLGSNVRNVQIDSLKNIGSLIQNKRLRESGNIFFIKLSQKDRFPLSLNKGSSTQRIVKDSGQQSLLPKFTEERYKQQWHEQMKKNLKVIRQTTQGQQKEKKNQTERKQQKSQNYRNNQITLPSLKDGQFKQQTFYFYKKQSLNDQLRFLKSNHRQEKSKNIQRQLAAPFNTELIGTQKTFYRKPLESISRKRNLSLRNDINEKKIWHSINGINTKQKQVPTQKSVRLENEGEKMSVNKLLQFKKNMSNCGGKEQLFTPWGYQVQYNESHS